MHMCTNCWFSVESRRCFDVMLVRGSYCVGKMGVDWVGKNVYRDKMRSKALVG